MITWSKYIFFIVLCTLMIDITNQLNAAIEIGTYFGLQKKCLNRGGRWKNGKCYKKKTSNSNTNVTTNITPPLTPEPTPTPLPIPTPTNQQTYYLVNNSDNHITITFYDINKNAINAPTESNALAIPQNAAFVSVCYTAYDSSKSQNTPYTVINMEKISNNYGYTITNPFCNCNPDGTNAKTCNSCGCNNDGNANGFNNGCTDPNNPHGYWTMTQNS